MFFAGGYKIDSSAEFESDFPEEYEYFSEHTGTVIDGHITSRTVRFKRHYYIAGRKFTIEPFISDATEICFSGIYWTAAIVKQPLKAHFSFFLRPSYYVFLFWYALY